MSEKKWKLPLSADAADKAIKKLKPSDKDQYFSDSKIPGLSLRLTPAGCKRWHLRYQADVGRTTKAGRKFSFGDFSEGMNTREAREFAEDLRVRIRQGEDPLEERRRKVRERRDEQRRLELEERAQKTLNDVASAYQTKLANPVSGHKDGGDSAMSVLNNHLLSTYGDMPIKQFRREHLFDAVDSVLARGHNSMANAVLTNSKTFFRFAVKRGYIEYSSIEVLGKRDVGGPDKLRDRVLCETEFKKDELTCPQSLNHSLLSNVG